MRATGWSIALFVGASMSVGAVASRAHAEEGGGLHLGVGARIGMVTSEWSPSGFWFEADAHGRLELSRAFYVLGEVGFAVSRDTLQKSLGYHQFNVNEENEDKRLLLTVPLRATLGLYLVRVVSLELGGLVGPTRLEESSTQCGDDRTWGLVGGLFAGPAFHFGQTRAAVHLQAVYSPVWRCTNGATNPVTGKSPWPRQFHDSDPAPAILAVLSHTF